MSTWEAFAIRYADQQDRTRARAFLMDDNHNAPYPIDFYIWLLRRGDEVILVDTGFDGPEAKRRGFALRQDIGQALQPFGLTPEDITQLIVTHLHFDHAGGLHLFPNATIYLQPSEMAYATGPCMCHDALRAPFTGAHVCEAVSKLYAGKLIFTEGEAQIADGVTVHEIGGHSRGLQAVRVRTEAGWLVLASDASHFYENFEARRPFPIVVDMEDMLTGFETLYRLASTPDLIVPGHDPLVRTYFPNDLGDEIWRLDRGRSG
ncbi:MAG: N-acyl homoserine lactonase family protein [Paracoccaceae bacterium]|nr:N-acyl homoserine lactonase family protein [Paracoccaceae bacterium]